MNCRTQTQHILVIGGTSGIGKGIAKALLQEGHIVGVSGRNLSKVDELARAFPDTFHPFSFDLNSDSIEDCLDIFSTQMGGIDIFIQSAGVGTQNPNLLSSIQKDIIQVNLVGFTRCIDWAFRYFTEQGSGHIVGISSVAGTRGIGISALYSASKSYQSTYLDALSQLNHSLNCKIAITDICPGFVDTPMLKYKYPLTLPVDTVAERAIVAIKKRKRRVTIDYKFRILIAIWRLIPQLVWERMRLIKMTPIN